MLQAVLLAEVGPPQHGRSLEVLLLLHQEDQVSHLHTLSPRLQSGPVAGRRCSDSRRGRRRGRRLGVQADAADGRQFSF